MSFHEITDQLLLEITALTGPKLLMAFLVAVGYALQAVPQVPNRFIPHVNIALGSVLAPLFIGVPATGQMPHNLALPDVTAWAQVLMTGFLLSCATWLMHAKLLKPLIDDKLAGSGPNPLPPQPGITP
jgi:drug/metabolite transporter (DMT)-like permease